LLRLNLRATALQKDALQRRRTPIERTCSLANQPGQADVGADYKRTDVLHIGITTNGVASWDPRMARSFESVLAQETATLALFTNEKGGVYGSQRNQEMRAPGLYVSGHFGAVLQPAVRSDGRNSGRGLQVPSLGLRGQNGIRGPRITNEGAVHLGKLSRPKG
jgi:hypothetical protein